MKRIDKLVLGNFLGPFILTFLVVIFILLSQFMLKYIDEIVGKDLGAMIILQLLGYFSIFVTPNAFPLAVLLSSLMTFGNLGQHFELTAMKGAGISLIRVLVPIFVFSTILTLIAYYSNNYIVPKANLKAFSLLYDVKQKKPSMELKEGAFYNGIEGYSIKVGKKLSDGKTLMDLIIYDHTAVQGGNTRVTMADSGMMYNILNDRYMVIEMFNGKTYNEDRSKNNATINNKRAEPLFRNYFKSQKVVFSLASFDLKRTREELFASNRLMKNREQLKVDLDSMKLEYVDKREEVKEHSFRFFEYHLQDLISEFKQKATERAERNQLAEEEKEKKRRLQEQGESNESPLSALNDSTNTKQVFNQKNRDTIGVGMLSNRSLTAIPEIKMDSSAASKIMAKKREGLISALDRKANVLKNDSMLQLTEAVIVPKDTIIIKRTHERTIFMLDSMMNTPELNKLALNKSLTHVRYVKNNMEMRNGQLLVLKGEVNKFSLEYYKKMSYACTILIMFFIGAPLGSIIKRGGLGVPVLISISFFIMFYVISMICEKYTRTDRMDPLLAAWMANLILFPIGMFFMKQARNDARLFDADFYSVAFIRIKDAFFRKKQN